MCNFQEEKWLGDKQKIIMPEKIPYLILYMWLTPASPSQFSASFV